MDPQLKATCAQTIYVAAISSVSSYGDPTYGTPAAVDARVEPDVREIVGVSGERMVTSYRVITEAAIAINSRIWLPGDSSADATLARHPMKVTSFPGEDGNTHHYECYV